MPDTLPELAIAQQSALHPPPVKTPTPDTRTGTHPSRRTYISPRSCRATHTCATHTSHYARLSPRSGYARASVTRAQAQTIACRMVLSDFQQSCCTPHRPITRCAALSQVAQFQHVPHCSVAYCTDPTYAVQYNPTLCNPIARCAVSSNASQSLRAKRRLLTRFALLRFALH